MIFLYFIFGNKPQGYFKCNFPSIHLYAQTQSNVDAAICKCQQKHQDTFRN